MTKRKPPPLETLEARDLYLHVGRDVRCYRVWRDPADFVEARVIDGMQADKPYGVRVATREDYLAHLARLKRSVRDA